MNKKILICTMTVTSLIVAAYAFEPAFKLVQPEGKVRIKVAGERRFETPKVDQAYAYGSTINLEKDASINVILGGGSSVMLIGPANVIINEDGKEKIFDIKQGKAEFNLAKDFNADGNKLTVKSGDNEVTPFSAGTFSMDNRKSYSFDVLSIVAETAKIAIDGAQYNVKSFGPKSEVVITTANDGTFSKIFVPNGNMDITFETDDGDKDVRIEKGETVNIWRQISSLGSTVTSTVMITSADSTVKTQFSFSKQLEKRVNLVLASTTTTTTTTTTTSTTTLKSPTPVGER